MLKSIRYQEAIIRKIKKMSNTIVKIMNRQCAIDLENFNEGEEVMYLPCQHFFHSKCILKVFEESRKCPVCQVDVRELLQKQEGFH